MEQIGYNHIQGFRINIPYLLQDLADRVMGVHDSVAGFAEPFATSVNQEYNRGTDEIILETAGECFHWWKPGFDFGKYVFQTGGGAGIADLRHDVAAQFIRYHNAVIREQYKMMSRQEGRLIPYLDTDEVVPGLHSTPPTPSAAPPPSGQSCPTCVRSQVVVKRVLEKLQNTQANVAKHLREANEAAARSCNFVNAYTELENISDHVDPFASGSGLPKEYRKKFPKHQKDDPDRDQANIKLAMKYLDPTRIMIDDNIYRFLCFKELPPPLLAWEWEKKDPAAEPSSPKPSSPVDSVLGGLMEEGGTSDSSIPEDFIPDEDPSDLDDSDDQA